MNKGLNILKKAVNVTLLAGLMFVFVYGLVVSVQAEIERSNKLDSIEQTILSNKDNAVVIEDSEYTENIANNRYYVYEQILKSNAKPVVTVDHVDDNGKEFTNAYYVIEHNGQIGVFMSQDIYGDGEECFSANYVRDGYDTRDLARNVLSLVYGDM